jgi:hypothetical protein
MPADKAKSAAKKKRAAAALKKRSLKAGEMSPPIIFNGMGNSPLLADPPNFQSTPSLPEYLAPPDETETEDADDDELRAIREEIALTKRILHQAVVDETKRVAKSELDELKRKVHAQRAGPSSSFNDGPPYSKRPATAATRGPQLFGPPQRMMTGPGPSWRSGCDDGEMHGNFSIPMFPHTLPLRSSVPQESPAPNFGMPGPTPPIFSKTVETIFKVSDASKIVDTERHIQEYDHKEVMATSMSGKMSNNTHNQVIATTVENARIAIGPLIRKYADLLTIAKNLHAIGLLLDDPNVKSQIFNQVTILVEQALTIYEIETDVIKSLYFSLNFRNLIHNSGVSKALEFAFSQSMQPRSGQDDLDRSLKEMLQSSFRFEVKKAPAGEQSQNRPRFPPVQAFCNGCNNRNVQHTRAECNGINRRKTVDAKADPAPTLTATSAADPKPP